jgi:hypothetical protein
MTTELPEAEFEHSSLAAPLPPAFEGMSRQVSPSTNRPTASCS